MIRIFKYLLVSCTLLALPSCKQDGKVYGSGKVVEKGESIGEFDRIEFKGIGHLLVRQEEEHSSFHMKADDNILPFINARVKGRTLMISTPVDNGLTVSPSRTIEYFASTSELNRISLAGDGSIESQNPISGDYLILNSSGSGKLNFDINVEKLEINMTANARLELRGIAETQKIQLSEKTSYDGSHLQSQKAFVRMTGNGKAWLNVTETLEAEITGDGIIEYTGKAQVTARIVGNGKVINRDKASQSQ